MNKSTAYLSNSRPQFESFAINCGNIPAYRYKGTLKSEIKAGALSSVEAVAILEDMLVIRELEEMIVKLRSGAYEPIRDFNYRGPTHVSVGQEGTAAGACCALQLTDNITSTHRGHGESLAKGTVAIRQMTDEQLRRRVPNCKSSSHEDLVQAALEEHVYRTICELFGKDDGYCRGRGGSMHIADFTVGHLGANAIVGAACQSPPARLWPIVISSAATWFAVSRGTALTPTAWCWSLEFRRPGPVHQPSRHCRKYGLPIVFLVCNNHYGMTHRSDDEVMGVDHIARRAAGFADNNMHAEIVNGMNVAGRARCGLARHATLPPGPGTRPPGRGLLPLLGPLVERSAQ